MQPLPNFNNEPDIADELVLTIYSANSNVSH